MLALNVFLLLESYYVLKTVRESLILGQGSAELKSYLAGGQVVVLTIVVPLYARLVARFARTTHHGCFIVLRVVLACFTSWGEPESPWRFLTSSG
jgi:AAA family ATP:ADP antiporter